MKNIQTLSICTLRLRHERHVMNARQRARDIAALLGFEHQEQIRLATTASELARNAFRYATNGVVEFLIVDSKLQLFVMSVTDSGPGDRESCRRSGRSIHLENRIGQGHHRHKTVDGPLPHYQLSRRDARRSRQGAPLHCISCRCQSRPSHRERTGKDWRCRSLRRGRTPEPGTGADPG